MQLDQISPFKRDFKNPMKCTKYRCNTRLWINIALHHKNQGLHNNMLGF